MNISHSEQFLFIQLPFPLLPSLYPDLILWNDNHTQRVGWPQPTPNKEEKDLSELTPVLRFVILKTKSCRDSLHSFLVAPTGLCY